MLFRHIVVIALAFGVASAPALAQTYKWKDEKGVTHYGDRPPSGVAATQMSVGQPGDFPAVEGDVCRTYRCQLERLQADKAHAAEMEIKEQEARAMARAAVAPQASARGLPFATFIMLRRGMSEAEVLVRAGPPDHQGFSGYQHFGGTLAPVAPVQLPSSGKLHAGGRRVVARHGGTFEVKSFTYLPTSSDPYTTVITFTGGYVSDLQRIKKF